MDYRLVGQRAIVGESTVGSGEAEVSWRCVGVSVWRVEMCLGWRQVG